jgi:RNA polymerase sigma-70 factor (ECF subfamily)
LEPSDWELWQSAAGGDQRAFHVLVDRHAPAMMRLARSLSGTRADAEDICQETFAAAFRGLKSFNGQASVKTWLSRILMRRAAKIWHKQRYSRRTISIHAEARDSVNGNGRAAGDGHGALAEKLSVSPATAAVDQRMDLMDIVRSLPEEFRDVVLLREVQGLSYQEIAETLGIPRGTVESRLHRGRAELRKKLKGYAPEQRET